MKNYPFDANYPVTLTEVLEILEHKASSIGDKKPASMGKREGIKLSITVIKDFQKNQEKS